MQTAPRALEVAGPAGWEYRAEQDGYQRQRRRWGTPRALLSRCPSTGPPRPQVPGQTPGLSRPTLARACPRNHTSGHPPAQAASPLRKRRNGEVVVGAEGHAWPCPGRGGVGQDRREPACTGAGAREAQRLEAPEQPAARGGASAGRPAPPVGSPDPRQPCWGLTQAQRETLGPAPQVSQLLTQ